MRITRLKSHGIALINVYGKRPSNLKAAHHQIEDQLRETMATVETNLLIQQKEQCREQLENIQKPFWLIGTSLKTWPLQDMAMEHLDHVLGKHLNSQFHGGDYHLSKLVSSIALAGEGKQRTSPSNKQRMPEHLDIFANSTTKLSWSQEPRIFATEKAQGNRSFWLSILDGLPIILAQDQHKTLVQSHSRTNSLQHVFWSGVCKSLQSQRGRTGTLGQILRQIGDQLVHASERDVGGVPNYRFGFVNRGQSFMTLDVGFEGQLVWRCPNRQSSCHSH
jgi:hypothetical protein